jgi:L-aspartate oxidase
VKEQNCNLLIIGAGAAGLSAALAAQKQTGNIIILSKGPFLASGSTFRNRNNRWGITFAENDCEQDLLFDAVTNVSKGTNDLELSRLLVQESAAAFRMLRGWGVDFLQQGDTLLRVSPCFCFDPLAAIINDTEQFAGTIERQIDWERVTVLSGTAATGLKLTGNRINGVLASREGKEITINAKAVILATGGAGGLHQNSITEPGLTGDGHGLLTRAGIELHNMQFEQWAWEDVSPNAPRFSFSAFFDERYSFCSADGVPLPFPPDDPELLAERRNHVPIGNLQADRQMDQVLLDHLTSESESAIRVYDRQSGKLINRIYPHFMANNGGIKIGPDGETGIDGLFAAGELTTGMHGADRIGGMMMASCFVFGRRAGLAACEYLEQ